MGLQEELKMIEAKIRDIYVKEIQPLEDIRQKIQEQINNEEVDVVVNEDTITTIKLKYEKSVI